MYGEDELKAVSEAYPHTFDFSTTDDPNVGSATEDEEHFCKLVLYKEIQGSRVRIWDVMILVPNLLFLLFVLVRCNHARLKLRATSSPIFLAFYGLVICNVVISVIRCVVSMTVNASATAGGKVDKVLWVTVRFFLLLTEMSVVIFGLAFGHLDSRSSIRRVLLATCLIALVFTVTQGTLEFVLPDDTFHIPSRDFYVFGHGGMMFWFCSSLVFTLIYIFILILPWTRVRDRLTLPSRISFYVYAGTLATLNLVQSIGAGLLNYTQNPAGLCVVDITAAIYLTFFTPLVYYTFLSEFFGISQPSIMFSYKAQVDDAMDEDTVSLPHQQSFSSLRTDSDYIYQVHTPSIHMPLYESLASKPSASMQKTSLYSPSSKMDPKTASTSRSSSQMTLYGTSPDAKNLLGKRRNTQKSTPDLGNRSMFDSENFVDSQKSTPDLSFDRPGWNSETRSTSKYPGAAGTAGPAGISNIILSQSTASNFIYKPNDNDSNANLFSESSKTGSVSTIQNFPIQDTSSCDRVASLKIAGQSEFQSANCPSSRSAAPHLESSLENILNNDSRKTVDPSQTPVSERESSMQNFIELSSANLGKTGIRADSSPSIDIETRMGSSSSSYENPRLFRDVRDSIKPEESGGLGDYLRSMKSPKSQNPATKERPMSGDLKIPRSPE